MKQYLDLCQHIIKNGHDRSDRTGTGTLGIFGHQMRFNLQHGFPLLTTKKMFFRGIVGELLWFLKGRTDVRWLQDQGISIWDEWELPDGTIGPGYGHMWRHWEGDQLQTIIKQIKETPQSRRHIVSTWSPALLNQQALPPCHVLFQFYVQDNRLSCHLYQRSADVFLGLPFNIASYALLTHIIALECELQPGEFIWSGGDIHIYSNHIEQIRLQIEREPVDLPKPIFDYEISDIQISNYTPWAPIQGQVSK